MKYIIITVVAISVSAIFIYMFGNKMLGLRLRSLIMCGLCAIFLSLLVPRIVVNFTSVSSTIALFAVLSIVLAGFVVYYEDKKEIVSAVIASTVIEVEPDALPHIEDLGQHEVEDKKPKVGSDTMDIDKTKLSPAMHSLDDLLECAFSYKEQGTDSLALTTFEYALRLHGDKEIAPLLVIEIAKLLKNKGAYDEAIALLTSSRNLTAIHENRGLDQDFINTIAYLRIIKNTLLENQLGYIPIANIPTEIVKDIDEQFQEWRNFI